MNGLCMPTLPVLLLATLAASAAAGQITPPTLANVPYASQHPDQVFDWYAPLDGASGPHPVAIFMHGAFGAGGTKEEVDIDSLGVMKELLLHNGVGVASMDFHPFPQFIYPVPVDDGAKMVQYLRQNAAAYGIDPAQVYCWGNSGGGVISGLLAYGKDYADPLGSAQEQQSSRPDGFVNFSALTNFLLMVPSWPGVMFGQTFLGQVSPALLDLASCAENVIDVPRAFTPPVVSYYNNNENPPPVTDPHDVTMMKDLHAKLQAFPATAALSLTIIHQVGSGLSELERCAEWVLERAGIHHALVVPGGLANGMGVLPSLAATAPTTPGGGFTLSCQSSTNASASLVLLLGGAHFDAPLPGYGGLLVPVPQVAVVLPTDAAGHLDLPTTVPASVPVGAIEYLQFWQQDPQAAKGVAGSNAIRVRVE